MQLDVTGMSCGSCAARIEKRLNKIEGVRARVDYSTKIAIIEAAADITAAELCSAVRNAGYGAELRPEGAAIIGHLDELPPAGLGNRLMAAATASMRWMHQL